MASQPRPPWFRFSLGNRPPAPPPPPPAPVPTVRPSFPITATLIQPPPQRPASPPPPQTPAPQPSSPRSSVAPPIRPSVPPPAPPPAPSSNSPIRSPPPSTKTPQASPLRNDQETQSPRPSISSKPVTAAESPKAKTPTPIASPKTIKAFEEESPKTKPLSPSPLTLPPAQAMSDEDKAIDKTVRMSRARNINGINASDGKREQNTPKDKGISRNLSDPEPLRMITLAGENKGAAMELNPRHNKTYSPQSLRNGRELSSENGEDGKSRNTEKGNGASGYFNCNVQGLNNSILYNTNVRQNDPGIHLSLNTKPNAKD